MKERGKSEDLSRKLLLPKELAGMLQVSIQTIYGWCYRKEIPYKKLGNLLRFDQYEIANWLEKRSVRPV